MQTLLFSILLIFVSNSQAANTLVLSLGDPHKIPLHSSSVWIEDKKILQAEADGSNLVLKGLQVGQSLLRANGQLQTVQVLHPAQADSYQRLEQVIHRIIGPRLAIEDGQLVLRGHIYRFRDWKQIAAEHLRYSMRAEMSETVKKEAEEFMITNFRQQKLPKQNIIFADSIEMRINPKSAFKEKYQRLLSPYGIEVILDQDSLEPTPTVKVQITVAEVKRDLTMKYGLRWPDTYAATVLHKTIDDFSLTANAFEAKGYGKILASPNIICKSGQEAEFLAGGEFPIKIMNYKIQDIVWKRYGIYLKVKPIADSSGKMSISIETEVSTLDNSKQVDGIPGVLTNHVSSYFDLAKPQTIALSGLIKNENGNGHEGLPLLSRIPILGALFSSKDFMENRSELVIFVRPSILNDDEPAAKGSHLGDIE